MDFSYSNCANNTLNSSENCVIQKKQHDLTGHFTHALHEKKSKTVPSKSKSKLDVYKQPDTLLKKAFARVPSENSTNLKCVENSLFFQLLYDRYLHLFGKNEVNMTKSNKFHQTKSFNISERSDNIINTCAKTVQDGMTARKALKSFRLHKPQKKIFGASKSATNTLASNVDDINKNICGKDSKIVADEVNVPIKNKSVQLCKTTKNVCVSGSTTSRVVPFDETIEGKCRNQNFQMKKRKEPVQEDKDNCLWKNVEGSTKQCAGNKNSKPNETVEGTRKKRKLRKLNANLLVEEKKSTKEGKDKYFQKTMEGHKKQFTDNKNRLRRYAVVRTNSGRRVKVERASIEDMSGDTSTDSDAPRPVLEGSGFKLEKTKNSRNIPNEVITGAPKKKIQRKEVEIPSRNNIAEKSALENNLKRKKKKLRKAISCTGLTDLTQTPLKMSTNKHIQVTAAATEDSLNSARKVNSRLLVMDPPVTPTRAHLKSPRVLTKMCLETDTTKSLETEEGHLETALSTETILKTTESLKKHLQMDLQTNIERLEAPVTSSLIHRKENTAEESELALTMQRTRVEQLKFNKSIEAALKIPAKRSEESTHEMIQTSMKRPKTPIQAIWKMFAEGPVRPITPNLNTCMEEFQTTVETEKNHTETNFENVIERPRTRTETKIVDTPLILRKPMNDACLANSSGGTTKACIKYNRKAQHALSVLNNEVSSALRESFCSIDDIKFRIRSTVEEINEADKLYQRLKAQHQLASQSTPHLSEPDQITDETGCYELLHALSIGLVQTQSENQLRLATLSNNNENMCEGDTCVHEIDESPLKIPPLAYPVVNTQAHFDLVDVHSTEFKKPILPKIVQIVEDVDQPCTKLKQQKVDIFNIPPCISLQTGDCATVGQPSRRLRHSTSHDKVVHTIRRQQSYGLKQPSSPLSKICSMKVTSRNLSPEIKLRLKEIAVRLGLDDLPRSRAQPDLYNKLIKEFVATDSLIEFQRQMKHVNQAKEAKEAKEANKMRAENETNPLNEVKVGKKNKVIQIMAEELYVPDRKINKIAPTNLNTNTLKTRTAPRLKPRCCQFLYREKKKKRNHSHVTTAKKELDNHSSNTIRLSRKMSSKSKQSSEEKRRKYANSLYFSSHQKKESRNSIEQPLKQPVAITSSDAVIKCDSKKSNITVENMGHTQTDNSSNKAYWRQLNLQSATCKSGLDCFDILDEISLRDLKPLESEYPRKDHIGSEPFHKQAENTYLYKLVYGSTHEQFLQLLTVEEPELHCTTANCQTCGGTTQKITEMGHKRKTSEDIISEKSKNESKGMTENTRKSKKDTEKPFAFLYNQATASSSHSTVVPCKRSCSIRSTINSSKQQQRSSKGKSRKKALNTKQEVATNIKQPEQPVDRDNIDNKKPQTKPKTKKTKKSTQDVASRLLPYIFDPKMRYPTTITVMPVTVTTYTNPNFALRGKSTVKGQSGDFSPTRQNNPENKTQCKNKPEPKPTKSSKIPKPPISDKKLWETKYAKSPSINLISYLEKQQLDVPKRTLPDNNDNLLSPGQKSAPTSTATKLGKRNIPPDPQPFHAHTLRTHSQPHNPVKGSTVKHVEKASTKTVGSRSPRDKPTVETQNMQKIPEKTTLESDIQNVIEMIEGKIIDLVSSPDKLHSEAFNTVEKEIVGILKSMQNEQVPPLSEVMDVKRGSDSQQEKRTKKSKRMHSNTSTDLQKPLESNNGLTSRTDPTLESLKTKISGLLTSGTIPREIISSEDLDHKSSNEETFVITSACAPTQTPRIKLDQDINVAQIDIEDPEKIDAEGQTSGYFAMLNRYENDLPKPPAEPAFIKSIQLDSSKQELLTSENDDNMCELFPIKDITESKSVVETLQEPPIIEKTPELDNIGYNFEEIRSNSNIIKTIPETDNSENNVKILHISKLEDLVTVLSESKIVPEIQEKLQDVHEDDTINNLLNREKSGTDVQPQTFTEIQIIESISDTESFYSGQYSVVEEQEDLQETSSVPVETTALVEVRSDEFLTPFMHAVKQYRQEEHSTSSCNILEFLETLTSISADTSNFCSKTITGYRLSTVHYKHKMEAAHLFHQAEVFYPIVIWEPVAMLPETNKKLKVLFQSNIITDELQRARSLFSSLHLSRLLGFESLPPVTHPMYPKSTTLYILQRSASLKVLCNSVGNQSESKPMQPEQTYDQDHGMFLNTVYGMLFSVVFLSLSFNYTC